MRVDLDKPELMLVIEALTHYRSFMHSDNYKVSTALKEKIKAAIYLTEQAEKIEKECLDKRSVTIRSASPGM